MLSDLGLLAMRLVVGGVFAAHGYPKLFGGEGKQVHPTVARYLGQGFVKSVEHGSPKQFATAVERIGAPMPMLMAWFVGGLEFFGGIALALGYLTRLVALLLAGEMVVSIARVHWRNGLSGPGGYEFSLTLLGACLALLGTGPGAIALEGGSATSRVGSESLD